MPYIKKEEREILDPEIDVLIEKLTHWGANQESKVGEVNYVISKLLWGILRKNGISYTRANNLIGVLGCVEAEMYRRVIAPHEEEKLKENGDI